MRELTAAMRLRQDCDMMSQPVTTQQETRVVEVAAPSKSELARKWFIEHNSDLELSARELEKMRQPQGVVIGYRTWSRVKKEFTP